ncbi:site-specific DNA-methyltransferase [Erwinia sp. 198]|nr:site-specific DNA-methyltransferase [Erwinia sp. 198]
MKDAICLPNVQLVNADSLQFIKTLPDNAVDLIVTDPAQRRTIGIGKGKARRNIWHGRTRS